MRLHLLCSVSVPTPGLHLMYRGAAAGWRPHGTLAHSMEGGHVACGEGEVLQRLPSPVKSLSAAAYRQDSEGLKPLSGPALLQLLHPSQVRLVRPRPVQPLVRRTGPGKCDYCPLQMATALREISHCVETEGPTFSLLKAHHKDKGTMLNGQWVFEQLNMAIW